MTCFKDLMLIILLKILIYYLVPKQTLKQGTLEGNGCEMFVTEYLVKVDSESNMSSMYF